MMIMCECLYTSYVFITAFCVMFSIVLVRVPSWAEPPKRFPWRRVQRPSYRSVLIGQSVGATLTQRLEVLLRPAVVARPTLPPPLRRLQGGLQTGPALRVHHLQKQRDRSEGSLTELCSSRPIRGRPKSWAVFQFIPVLHSSI